MTGKDGFVMEDGGGKGNGFPRFSLGEGVSFVPCRIVVLDCGTSCPAEELKHEK